MQQLPKLPRLLLFTPCRQRLLSTPVNQLDAETQQRGAKLDVALKSMSLDGYIKGIPRQLSRQLTRTLGKQDSVATVTHDLTGEAGSYSYMAPEVLKREQYNEKADIFR
jgi:serine/threonine protein kinase